MCWHLFHQTAIGGRHQQINLPCQDNAISEDIGCARIVITADGHGSKRHFRSKQGSLLACEAALIKLKEFFESKEDEQAPSALELELLKADILELWRNKVKEDFLSNPWSKDELADAAARLNAEDLDYLSEGNFSLIPYGSTLVVGVSTDLYWFGLQIGDGFLVVMKPDGEYVWPMPESRVNEGNRTASLCMPEPMPEFRHCFGTEEIIGLAVCTDGIEKAFPTGGEKVISFLHWLWVTAREEETEARRLLKAYAELMATRSTLKDDVGFAIMANTEAEDVSPHPSQQQRERDSQRLIAQLNELQVIIDYTQARLKDATSKEEVEQLIDIMQRRIEEYCSLHKKIYPEDDISEQMKERLSICSIIDEQWETVKEETVDSADENESKIDDEKEDGSIQEEIHASSRENVSFRQFVNSIHKSLKAERKKKGEQNKRFHDIAEKNSGAETKKVKAELEIRLETDKQ